MLPSAELRFCRHIACISEWSLFEEPANTLSAIFKYPEADYFSDCLPRLTISFMVRDLVDDTWISVGHKLRLTLDPPLREPIAQVLPDEAKTARAAADQPHSEQEESAQLPLDGAQVQRLRNAIPVVVVGQRRCLQQCRRFISTATGGVRGHICHVRVPPLTPV